MIACQSIPAYVGVTLVLFMLVASAVTAVIGAAIWRETR